MQASNSVPMTVELQNPKSIGLDNDYCCVKFPVRLYSNQGFLFYRANIHPHTNTYAYTYHDKVITISAPLYYVIYVDNSMNANVLQISHVSLCISSGVASHLAVLPLHFTCSLHKKLAPPLHSSPISHFTPRMNTNFCPYIPRNPSTAWLVGFNGTFSTNMPQQISQNLKLSSPQDPLQAKVNFDVTTWTVWGISSLPQYVSYYVRFFLSWSFSQVAPAHSSLPKLNSQQACFALRIWGQITKKSYDLS